jgi:hypothetical protein
MVVTNWKETRKEISIFWERNGNFVLRKDRKGMFCFRKLEALYQPSLNMLQKSV